MSIPPALPEPYGAVAASTKGFLPYDEGLALHAAALTARAGLWLEIGSYCGKSTVHLGAAARAREAQVVTLDHHRGSEENQPGWQWHDSELIDEYSGRIDTLPALRHTLWDAGLEEVVTALVASTQQVATWWSTALELLFLDGNHTEDVAQHDYARFACHLVTGGLLIIHDVFPDPADGGRPPFHVYERALSGGAFSEVSATGSLRVLRRTDGPFEPLLSAPEAELLRLIGARPGLNRAELTRLFPDFGTTAATLLEKELVSSTRFGRSDCWSRTSEGAAILRAL